MTSTILTLKVRREYTENDRQTGRPEVRPVPVPASLEIRTNEDGEIIVCHAGKGDAKDIVFIGDPTPDMLPVDDEAKAISATLKRNGGRSLNMAGATIPVVDDKFQVDMDELFKACRDSRPCRPCNMIGKLVESNQKIERRALIMDPSPLARIATGICFGQWGKVALATTSVRLVIDVALSQPIPHQGLCHNPGASDIFVAPKTTEHWL